MDRKTRVIETARDRKGELFLGAMALGGALGAAATLHGDEEDEASEPEADDAETDAGDEA